MFRPFRGVSEVDTPPVLLDINGDVGLLPQVNGRAAKSLIDWLAEPDPAWRVGTIRVAVGMSST